MTNILEPLKRLRQNTNLRNIAYILILFLAILLSLFFGEVNNAPNAFGKPFNLWETILFYLAILAVYSLSFYIAIRNNILKVNKGLISFVIISITIIFYMIMVVSLTDYQSLNISNNPNIFTDLYRFKSILDTSLCILMGFSFFFLIPSFKEKDLAIRIFSFLFISFTAVMIIYSLSTEMDKIRTFIEHPSFFNKNYSGQATCKSFFFYGNVYGHVLFLCMLVFTLLSVSFKHRFIFLFNFVLALFVLFSGSRTAFLGFITLCVVYAIYYLLHLYKRRRIYFYVLAIIFLFVIITFLLEVLLFKNLTITESILQEDGSYIDKEYTLLEIFEELFVSLVGRFHIFNSSFEQIFSLSNVLLGVGYNLNDQVCRQIDSSFFNFHNGYIEILTTGGIFLCLVYLGLFSYITYKAIKLHKHYPKYTMFYFVSLVPYLLYQFGEAFVPLFNVFGGGMMGFFLIAVVNMKYREVNETCDIKYLFVHNDNKEKENVA